MQQLLNRLRSDEALMLAYGSGESHAFEQLYRRHKDSLFAFLYRGCRRQAVAEELAQDTWMAVVDRAGQYRPEAKFRTWLFQIAHNRQVDYWRRRDNRHLSLADKAAELPDPVAPQPDAESAVMAVVGTLPREQQDALLLQVQGFTLADIAAITGAGEETVKSRLRYGRKHLKAQLEADS